MCNMNTLTLRFATLHQRQKLQFNCDAIQQATLLLIHKAKLSTVHLKKTLHSGCYRGRKYKLSPWVNASGDKANMLKLRLVPLKSRHRLSFSHQDEKDFCEYTTGILPAMCRNYMSKNTFCCGDKIPILVHTCGSTERNYAFLFYY